MLILFLFPWWFIVRGSLDQFLTPQPVVNNQSPLCIMVLSQKQFYECITKVTWVFPGQSSDIRQTRDKHIQTVSEFLKSTGLNLSYCFWMSLSHVLEMIDQICVWFLAVCLSQVSLWPAAGWMMAANTTQQSESHGLTKKQVCTSRHLHDIILVLYYSDQGWNLKIHINCICEIFIELLKDMTLR